MNGAKKLVICLRHSTLIHSLFYLIVPAEPSNEQEHGMRSECSNKFIIHSHFSCTSLPFHAENKIRNLQAARFMKFNLNWRSQSKFNLMQREGGRQQANNNSTAIGKYNPFHSFRSLHSLHSFHFPKFSFHCHKFIHCTPHEISFPFQFHCSFHL